MKALFFVLGLLVGVSAVAGTTFDPSQSSYQGFVQVEPQRELYVDYVKAKSGQETVVLLNGLTYSTRQWEAMTQPLLARGIGVLRFDMFGQGETLLKYAPMTAAIPYQTQITDLKTLLTKLELQGPYNLVGLSYGGGIAAGYAAAYPTEVKNLILISPYTQPLQTQDQMIKAEVQATRLANPLNPATDDELYDFFLRQNVYTTYPACEPIVLENPFKLEATFRLVQGIRKFYPQYITRTIPAGTLHLMIARQDQYIPNSVLDAYWNATPKASRASRVYVNGSEHKIPEAVPLFAADWVARIVSGEAIYHQGRTFDAYPLLGEVRLGDKVIRLEE
jgi:pimeloyl-ACP methyl ester carboxylesterase